MALFPEARRSLETPAGVPVHDPGHDIAASREQARAEAAAEPREDVAEVRDLDAGGVPCRLYRPVGARPGVVVHLHGGGFVFHDVDVHDAAARRLANRCGRAVLSVDYRRPPEHPFPAAPDDVSTVVRWLQAGGLPGPYAVHGDSAGGNLALVAALRHPGALAATVLVYPFLDPTAGFGSYELTGVGFEPQEAAWYWQQYAAGPADLEHPDLAPLRSEGLGGVPPTLVVTAEHDLLRDEGEHLALRHPGVLAATVLVYPFLDPTADFGSYRLTGVGFEPEEAAWYWQQYAAGPADLEHPDLAPLRSDGLGGVPPTLVVTAEHDLLRDEGEHLALRLAEEGVEAVSTRYQGQLHGFWRHPADFPAAEALLGQTAAFLRQHLP